MVRTPASLPLSQQPQVIFAPSCHFITLLVGHSCTIFDKLNFKWKKSASNPNGNNFQLWFYHEKIYLGCLYCLFFMCWFLFRATTIALPRACMFSSPSHGSLLDTNMLVHRDKNQMANIILKLRQFEVIVIFICKEIKVNIKFNQTSGLVYKVYVTPSRVLQNRQHHHEHFFVLFTIQITFLQLQEPHL